MCRETSTVRGGTWATGGSTTLKAGPIGSGWMALALAAAVSSLTFGCMGSVGGDGQPGGNGPSGPGGPGVDPGSPGGGPSTPGGPNVPAPAPTTCKNDQIGLSPLRRLTKLEYDNTIKDLLGVDLGLAKDFNADEIAGVFPSNFFTPVSEGNYTQYASAAAQAAVKTVERLGQLLPCAANVQANNETACVTQFIKQFGRRAYRRPLDDGEVGRFESVFRVGRSNGDFNNGIALVVQGMLESPHFLYLVEGPGALTQHQIANRLSYFLWNGPPDAKLSTLADGGQLRTPEALRNEAKRMLADPKAQEMIKDFYTRWLELEKLPILNKDAALYPDFEALKPAMQEEMQRFVSFVMGEGDGKLETLLTAPFTFADGALAKFYGVQGGSGWQKVNLDPAQRAGILTQSAFLAGHGRDSASPIFRGIAIREQFLCVELPQPPPGADGLLPPPSPTRTTRDRLEQHRKDPECNSCHQLMDTMGYGFESFDEMGRFRTTENNIKIDDAGEFVGTDVDGAFKGPIQLARKLAGSPQVHKCVTTQWFRYALGRMETELDACTLDAVQKRFEKSGFNLPELLMALVESDGFRIRRGEESK
jgi:hypothetical protein